MVKAFWEWALGVEPVLNKMLDFVVLPLVQHIRDTISDLTSRFIFDVDKMSAEKVMADISEFNFGERKAVDAMKKKDALLPPAIARLQKFMEYGCLEAHSDVLQGAKSCHDTARLHSFKYGISTLVQRKNFLMEAGESMRDAVQETITTQFGQGMLYEKYMNDEMKSLLSTIEACKVKKKGKGAKEGTAADEGDKEKTESDSKKRKKAAAGKGASSKGEKGSSSKGENAAAAKSASSKGKRGKRT